MRGRVHSPLSGRRGIVTHQPALPISLIRNGILAWLLLPLLFNDEERLMTRLLYPGNRAHFEKDR